MENKKTTELLDLLQNLDEEKGDYKFDGKHSNIITELKTREPFTELLNEDYDESLPSLVKTVNELKEEIKKLKRHKHDEKTNDVLIRI